MTLSTVISSVIQENQKNSKEAHRIILIDRLEPKKRDDAWFMPPIDLDPFPSSIHAYAAITHVFDELVDRLGSEDLGVKHRKLIDAAYLGWKPKLNLTSDIEENNEDFHIHCMNWHRLVPLWREMINTLLWEMQQPEQLLRKEGLILVTVRNLDMHPNSQEFLLAMRHLFHPRVLYVVEGSMQDLERGVALQQFARERSLARFDKKAQRYRAQQYAQDLLSKVIPSVLRLSTSV